MFTPFLIRAFSWFVYYPPMRLPATIKGARFKHLIASFWPWMQSYRVGQITIIVIPSALSVIYFFSKYVFISGIRYASVLPLPVLAFMIESLCLKIV
jgi:hypothetical protein